MYASAWFSSPDIDHQAESDGFRALVHLHGGDRISGAYTGSFLICLFIGPDA